VTAERGELKMNDLHLTTNLPSSLGFWHAECDIQRELWKSVPHGQEERIQTKCGNRRVFHLLSC
jgi:hypothetical protein